MGIKLSFEITSPLGPDDKDLLTGVSIMTLAIANHELAKEHFPGVFDGLEDDGHEQAAPDQNGPEPLPCGATNERDGSCISEVGHRGRHRFRAVGIDMRPRPTGGLHRAGRKDHLMTKEREAAGRLDPTTPPSSPPHGRDAQGRAEEIRRLLEEAERRGREEPGATTILVPSRKG